MTPDEFYDESVPPANLAEIKNRVGGFVKKHHDLKRPIVLVTVKTTVDFTH